MAKTITSSPHFKPRGTASQVEESFRTLRSNLLMRINDDRKCFLITSGRPGEGKSTVAANLAVQLAASEKKVLLLDADLRRPSLHRVFGVPNHRGFSDLLAGGADLDDVAQAVAQGLMLVTSGPEPADPQQLLLGKNLDRVLRPMRDSFDLIVVDSPPALSCADVTLLAVRTDGVILVLKSGESTTAEVRLIRERFQAVGATLLGSVLNYISGPGRELYRPYNRIALENVESGRAESPEKLEFSKASSTGRPNP